MPIDAELTEGDVIHDGMGDKILRWLTRGATACLPSKLFNWVSIIVIGILFCGKYLLSSGAPRAAWGDVGGMTQHVSGALYLHNHALLPDYLYWSSLNSEAQGFFIAPFLFVIPPYLLSFVTQDIWLIIKLIQVCQFILAGIFMYWMAQELGSKDRILSLVAAIAYMFNPLCFQYVRSTTSNIWLYALAPLTVLSIYRVFINRGSVFRAVLAGMVISVSTLWTHPEFILHLGPPLFAFCILQGLVFIGGKSAVLKDSVRVAWLTGVIWSSCILFSAFFLLPTLRESPVYSMMQEVIQHRTDTESVRLFSNPPSDAFAFQYAEIRAPTHDPELTTANTPQAFIIFFIFLSIFSFANLLFERNRLTISLSVLALISILLSQGPYSPLPLFQILAHLPFFSTAKAPARYISFLPVPISFLLAYTVRCVSYKTALWFKRAPQKLFIWSGLITIGIILVVGAVYNSSIQAFVSYDYERFYPDLQKIWEAKRQNDPQSDYRVIGMPSPYYQHPGWANLYNAVGRSLINQYELIERFHTDPSFSRVLGLWNIRYILTTPNWARYIQFFPELSQEIQSSPTFHPAFRTPAGVTIWENQKAAPRMYLTRPALVFGGPGMLASFYNLIPDYKPAQPPYGLIFASQLTGNGRSNFTLASTRYGVLPFDADFEQHLSQDNYNLVVFYNYAVLDYVARQMTQFTTCPSRQQRAASWPVMTGYDYSYKQYWPTTHARLLNDSWYHNTIIDQETLCGGAVYTTTPGTLSIPFLVDTDAKYKIYIRVWRTPATSISLMLDGNNKSRFGGSNAPGFEWMEVGAFSLDSGRHQLVIDKTDSKSLYIDALLIAPAEKIETKINQVHSSLPKDKPILYLYDALTFDRPEMQATTRKSRQEVNLCSHCSITMTIELLTSDRFSGGIQSSYSGLQLWIDGTVLPSPNSIMLGTGSHILKIYNPGIKENRIQSVWLLSGKDSITDLWQNPNLGNIEWQETSMHSFHYSVSTNSEALLVNTESYSEAWEMQSKDLQKRAIPVNIFCNGFWVPIGKSEFDIIYIPGFIRITGLILSGVPLVLIGMYLFYNIVKKGIVTGVAIKDWSRRSK
jgi:hypothetical protein